MDFLQLLECLCSCSCSGLRSRSRSTTAVPFWDCLSPNRGSEVLRESFFFNNFPTMYGCVKAPVHLRSYNNQFIFIYLILSLFRNKKK